VFTSLVVICIGLAIKHYAGKEQARFANDILTLVDSMAEETSHNLVNLNELPNTYCDAELMRKMRQFLFQSRHAKEIGFYSQNLQQCNTSLGVFETPLNMGEPDMLAKSLHELWIYSPSSLFDDDYLTFVIKSENYHIVLDPLEIITHAEPPFMWQWVYYDKTQMLPLYGEAGLYEDNLSTIPSIMEVKEVYCSSVRTYCVATYANLVASVSIPMLFFVTLLILLLLVIFYAAGSMVVNYWYSTELRIKRGLRNKSFYPVFQPIVELKSGRIIGCEVLARFEDKLGFLGPEHFIHKVSSMGKTVPFTRAILKSATSMLIKQTALPEGFKVNFNLFPNDLTAANIERLAQHKELFSTRFNICFEITEDEPFNNKQSQSVLLKLKALGADIAIDDFGTGYSNLDQLQSIPFDYLKIDRGFCMGLERSTFRASLIPQIVKIADILDVPLVAEGVETENQRKMLVKETVEYGQGFLFGRPMTATKLGDLFAKQRLDNPDFS